jgi:ABC-type uncharacterized transport system YnjBCD substrate-binding protein
MDMEELRKVITEKDLMEILPTWSSYAEEWGDDPAQMLISIEWYPEDPETIYIRDVTPEVPHTLEEITQKEHPKEFETLMQFLKSP